VKKKLIKHIKILKKPTGLVQFRFYKLETEKTEPKTSPIKKKTSQPKKSSQTEKKQANRFELILS